MSTPNNCYEFGPFRLEVEERRLSRAGQPVPLRGKVFDTLAVLVRNHGRLVRKDELMKAVWPDTVVEENNLDHNISQLRRTLGQSKQALYIETVPRQGYRFVATLAVSQPITPTRKLQSDIVERDQQLTRLSSALATAIGARRQVTFISGEAGIGKTTLVNAFLGQLESGGSPVITRGNCFDHRGEAEPYLPVLEAFTRLCRSDGSITTAFDRLAPSWLLQMPGVASADQIASLQQRLLGQTRERMLREMETALEEITAERPLILVLEDLHWADRSTLDLVLRIARGDHPMRLLLLGTFRTGDSNGDSGCARIVQELAVRGACEHIPLAPLSPDGVSQYLNKRFGADVARSAAHILHDRTEGSPLFVTAMLENWVGKGVVSRHDDGWKLSANVDLGAPESLREFLERQVSAISPQEREVLQAGSIAGVSFCASQAAAALERSTEEVEKTCVVLAQRGHFINRGDPIEFADGTLCEGFNFSHSFYRDVLYSEIPVTQRVRMHRRTGEWIEATFGDRVAAMAGDLAAHFREARDPARCIHYLRVAGETALQRSAPQEALAFLEEAFERLQDVDDSREGERLELEIQSLRGPALLSARGFAEPAAEAAYLRAFELARKCNDPRQLTNAFGLATMYELRGEYKKSENLMLEHLKEDSRFRQHLPEVRDLLACSNYHQGSFKTALEHAEEGIRAYVPSHPFVLTASMGENPGVGCHTWAALSLWFLGFPDQALLRAKQAVEMADVPGLEYSSPNARLQMAYVHQLRRDIPRTQAWAEETIAMSRKQGYAYRVAQGEILVGWASGMQDGGEQSVQRVQAGLRIADSLGAGIDRPYFLALLAELLIRLRRFAEAFSALDAAEAQVSASHSFFYAAELKRLRASLLLADGNHTRDARACFEQAINIAQRQHAKSLGLRAATSFLRAFPDVPEVYRILKTAYDEFTEGSDTADLREAAALLGELASHGTSKQSHSA